MADSDIKQDGYEEDGVMGVPKNQKDNLPVVRRASDFKVEYHSNSLLTEEENNKIKNAVRNEGIAVGYKTFVSEKGVKDLLNTDKKGAAIVFNNAPKDEVKTYGNTDYLSTPETQKEIAKRKEQARPELERQYLDTSSKALDAFSKNPELNEERTTQSDRNIKDRPKIGKRVLKKRKPEVSEVTGAKFDKSGNGKPAVHHVERASDNPDKFSEDKNLVVMRKDEHDEFHRDPNLLPTEEGLEEYRRRKRKIGCVSPLRSENNDR